MRPPVTGDIEKANTQQQLIPGRIKDARINNQNERGLS